MRLHSASRHYEAAATKDHPWTYVFVLGEGAGGLHDVI